MRGSKDYNIFEKNINPLGPLFQNQNSKSLYCSSKDHNVLRYGG